MYGGAARRIAMNEISRSTAKSRRVTEAAANGADMTSRQRQHQAAPSSMHSSSVSKSTRL